MVFHIKKIGNFQCLRMILAQKKLGAKKLYFKMQYKSIIREVMATFWLAKYVEEYYRLKLLCGKHFKSLEEYSSLSGLK